jgi:hypothetical protein
MVLDCSDIDDTTLIWTQTLVPHGGVLSLSGSGASRTATFISNGDWHGTTLAEITVSDPAGASDAIVLSITVAPVNDAPVILQGESAVMSMAEDTTSPTILSLAAIDVDADALSWSMIGDPDTGSWSLSTSGTSATVGYQAPSHWNGTAAATIRVADGQGGEDIITVLAEVRAVNDVPIIEQGSRLALTIPEDPATPVALALSAFHPDDESLTWSITTPFETGSASLIDGGDTASLTFLPPDDWFGQVSAIIAVQDAAATGDSITVTFTVTAVNDLPVLVLPPHLTLAIDEPVRVDATGSHDPDDWPGRLRARWRIVDSPDSATVTLADTATWNPVFTTDTAGWYTLICTADDGGDRVSSAVVLRVGLGRRLITIRVHRSQAVLITPEMEPAAACAEDRPEGSVRVHNASGDDKRIRLLPGSIH